MEYMSKFIILLLIICSCKANTKNDDSKAMQEAKQKAIELNNKVAELAKEFNNVPNRDSLIYMSLSLMEEAIKLNTYNQVSHLNKTNLLVELKNYYEAIRWIDTIKTRFPSNNEIVVFQGFLYEKVGNIDSANIIYNNVKKVFMDKLSTNPSNITFLLKIIELDCYLTNDMNDTFKKLNELLSKFPQNKEILNMIEIMKMFDKKKYIDESL
jgi:tetratricopeptide (TPR) repeat protein